MRRGRWAYYGAAGALSLLFLLPAWWALVAALRPVGLPPSTSIDWWPADPAWSNFRLLFTTVPFARYALNSLIVVALAVPLTLLTASIAGLGLLLLAPRARGALVNGSIALLLVPAAAVWLFRFQLFSWLGLVDTLAALIVPALAASNPLFVLLYYWSFRRIPGELLDAAIVDGTSFTGLWWQVALPLARPATLAVVVLGFVMYWSDFVNPLLYIYRPVHYTLPVGLQILKQLDATNWSLLLAGAVLVTAPIVLLFGIVSRLLSGNFLRENEGK